jgi:hypothetical protein
VSFFGAPTMTTALDSNAAMETSLHNNNNNNTATTNCSIVNHPDTIVFGSLAYQIANELSIGVDNACVEAVATTLPGDDTRLLLEKLRRVYFRNVDIFESYLVRNIFTLENTPYKHKVVEAFLNSEERFTNTFKENTNNTILQQEQVEEFNYPSVDEIPTPDELLKLQQSLLIKREKVKLARRKRTELLAKRQHVSNARASVQRVVATLENHVVNHKDIQNVIENKQELESLQVHAKQVHRELNDHKRARQEHEEEEVDVLAGTNTKKMTLEQTYKEQRTSTKTRGSLHAVHQMLQK